MLNITIHKFAYVGAAQLTSKLKQMVSYRKHMNYQMKAALFSKGRNQ